MSRAAAKCIFKIQSRLIHILAVDFLIFLLMKTYFFSVNAYIFSRVTCLSIYGYILKEISPPNGADLFDSGFFHDGARLLQQVVADLIDIACAHRNQDIPLLYMLQEEVLDVFKLRNVIYIGILLEHMLP